MLPSLFVDLEHLKWHWNYPLLEFEDFIAFHKNYLHLGWGVQTFSNILNCSMVTCLFKYPISSEVTSIFPYLGNTECFQGNIHSILLTWF